MHCKTLNFAESICAARFFAVAALLCAPLLAGCSTPVGDIPSPIALPAGTPERPAVPYTYPAVHDMPPDRTAPVMTQEQVDKAEAALVAARNRQPGGTAAQKPPAKKKGSAEAAGGTRNP